MNNLGVVLMLALLGLSGCVSKAEFSTDVRARRSFYAAVEPTCRAAWEPLPEPSKTTRLRLLRDEDASIQASEARAGLVAPVASGSTASVGS